MARRLTINVLNVMQMTPRNTIPSVEEIQDIVEDVLLASPFKKTAKAFILYRDQHARIREMTEKADLDLIDRYLDRLDWQVKENIKRLMPQNSPWIIQDFVPDNAFDLSMRKKVNQVADLADSWGLARGNAVATSDASGEFDLPQIEDN